MNTDVRRILFTIHHQLFTVQVCVNFSMTKLQGCWYLFFIKLIFLPYTLLENNGLATRSPFLLKEEIGFYYLLILKNYEFPNLTSQDIKLQNETIQQ